ncbi:MAG TPA: type II toxin-antitoxin system RelE/ParE family toxin [Candidatus Limnocylindrales bacterium]|nr:type II toxin-antitoxin system RelE/ParE family toxin [Candidatus Limnocylindrales bacterium]
MPERRLVLPPEAANVLRSLPPDAKRKVRAALDELRRDPAIGEALERELTGMHRLRVGRLRVVYRPGRGSVEIVAIGPRSVIYEALERAARSEQQ